jgi:hypothetical protein
MRVLPLLGQGSNCSCSAVSAAVPRCVATHEQLLALQPGVAAMPVGPLLRHLANQLQPECEDDELAAGVQALTVAILPGAYNMSHQMHSVHMPCWTCLQASTQLPPHINASTCKKRNTTHIHSIFHRAAAKTSTQAVAKARGWRTGMPYTASADVIMLGPSTVLLLLLPTQRRMHTCHMCWLAACNNDQHSNELAPHSQPSSTARPERGGTACTQHAHRVHVTAGKNDATRRACHS